MNNIYHTAVIGGGCLGVASAISLARKLNSNKNTRNTLKVIEQAIV